ncbi:ABC transporter permease [Murimonas intestini]|uniref:FtsX-like permease family protein n=1 Tax=Murimonas intestini TaxID=1337051 RepID=A0AB73T0N5_9FIRM|nr:FtsX-like permease family protein [Murimonas intestini]MCR1842370.1 FtsX-like permease family protein [Murimonas intestini]MCR1867707.1 FtsX-like permease family protein [Murimonas intestini]MCR1885981.1 FtsX-like permease family protein [Murimonas intestini]
MRPILQLALKEIRKKRVRTILMFVVCLIATLTVFTSITNATSAICQQKIFDRNLGLEAGQILHLKYLQTDETAEFTTALADFRNYIETLPGVNAVGQFDATGINFSELKTSEEYVKINQKILENGVYKDYPERSQVLYVDEALLPLVKGGISAFASTQSTNLPIYASEVFKDVVPVGTFLTDERTGEMYEVVGYFSKGSQWVEEDDLIRYPLVSLDGWFIAPFSDEGRNDILTQLSSLHNTYVLLSETADEKILEQEICSYSFSHGFSATAISLSEEYEIYRSETGTFTSRQIIIAIFISMMALTSIIAVFTTNTLLKRRQYGILIANGFTQKDIAFCIAAEIAIIVFSSTLVAWIIKFVEFRNNTDVFREALMTAHIQYTLPVCLLIAVILVILATLFPAFKLFQYQPGDLIGGNTNGND